MRARIVTALPWIARFLPLEITFPGIVPDAAARERLAARLASSGAKP